MIEITIPGKVAAKGRPRIGKGTAYTPEKTVNYENLVKYSFIEQCKGIKPLEGALSVTIRFYMPIPKSANKKDKALMELNIKRHTKKPDMDNCIKSVTDALNGFAYLDDSQIADLYGTKIYSHEPRVEVVIAEVCNEWNK